VLVELNVGVLEEWKQSLRDQDIEKSTALKEKLATEVSHAGYAIKKEFVYLKTKHELVKRDLTNARKSIIKMEKYLSDSDLLYLHQYHCMKGMLSLLDKKYEPALYHYKLAEKKIEAVTDPGDIAEFHYNISVVYYEVDKITLALQHVNKAVRLFDDQKNIKKIADCQVLLASCHYEIKQYVESERYYRKALQYSEKIEYSTLKSMVHHNLGYLYGEQFKSQEAIKQLLKSIELPGSFDAEHEIKTYFLLTRESYRLGNIENGNKFYEIGYELCNKRQNPEYKYHLRVLKSSYDPDYSSYKELENEYIEIINYFVENEIWYFVGQYGSILAQFYRDNGDFEEACEYYDLLVVAKEKLDYRGVLNG